MSPPTAAWTDINSIVFKFKLHANPAYHDAHKQLNATYAQEVSGKDLDALFTDATRTTLKQDAIAILRSKIVDLMIPQAIRTTDMQLIKQYTNDMPITSRISAHLKPWRTSPDIEATFLYGRNTSVTEITINLDIDGFHFLLHDPATPTVFFDPKCFEHISIVPFATATPIPQSPATNTGTGTGTNTTPGNTATTQDVNTLVTGIGTLIAAMNAQTAAAPAAHTGTGITTLNFQTAHLPPDVRTRFVNKRDSDYLMTGTEMSKFDSSEPDTRDPSGGTMRTAHFHLDPAGIGFRLFTRDGTCFQLTDPSTATEDKAFITNCPACEGSSPMSIRKWYKRFETYAAGYKVYVHPYYCFRPDSGSTRGFSCGPCTNEMKFDLPERYDVPLEVWDSRIYSAISQAKCFPKSSHSRSTILDNYGQGYAALYAIISSSHPEVIAQPSLLVTYPPKQAALEPIGQYFHAYLDYLEMKAYIDNISHTLNHKGELDRFIAGTVHHADFTRLSREERLSSDPIMMRRYTQGQIVTTLNRLQSLIPGATFNHHTGWELKPDDSDARTAATATSDTSSLTKSISTRTAASRYPRRKPGTTYQPRGIFPKRAIASVNAIDVDMTDPLASLTLPDTMSELDDALCHRYSEAVYAMHTSPNTFDINTPCKVCRKPGHVFKNCKVLQNSELLRAHFIGVCLKDDHLQKIIERHSKEVHSIDATPTHDDFTPDFRTSEE